MRYSIKPRGRIYVKGFRFLSFAKNIGKNLSNKYGQKLLHTAKKSTPDAIKTASKRAIQKTAEATNDLTGNKIADKITNVPMELHSKKTHNNKSEAHNTSTKDVPKKYKYFQKKANKLLMN